MRQIQNPVLRLTILACLTVGGLAINSVASAACTGAGDTCVGTDVLTNATGTYNTGIGYWALYSNTTGSFNAASGALALYNNTTGYANTASGYGALYSNTTGIENTASGYFALYNNTTGIENTANGYQTLYSNTTGVEHTASGYQALYSNTTGVENTAYGNRALYRNTTGSNNTANGQNALFSNTTGNYNSANGTGSLKNATSGYRNVALGYQSGYAVTTGSDNIIIGGGNQGLAADAGVIRIGTSAYQKKAFVAGIRGIKTGATGAVAVLIDANGQLGTINSSRRFKEDIQPMGSASERLFGLRPVTFRYKQPYDDGSKPVQFGLVAEEVAQVFPELVVNGKDGKPDTVSYHLLATLLLNEVQKDHRVMQAMRQENSVQAERIASLEKQTAELAALKAQVATMAKVIERLDKDRMVASAR